MKDYVGDKINRLCEKHHMTQYELAKRAGMTQSSVSNLMSRGTVPTLGTLEKICKGFGITLAQFFTEEGVFPDLSEEQQEMLNAWETLSTKEKATLMKILESIKELR